MEYLFLVGVLHRNTCICEIKLNEKMICRNIKSGVLQPNEADELMMLW